MKVFVTGANGLLGRKLVSLLEAQNDIQLMASSRKAISFLKASSQFFPADLCKAGDIVDAIKSAKPDVVIHAAAQTQVDYCELNRAECWETNVAGTEQVIEGCRATGAHLIYVSTDFVFDGSEGPLDETAIPRPVNYYGESKLAAESRVITSGIPAAIVRTVLVYGVTDDMSRSNIVLWVKKNLQEGKAIQVVNDQFRTPTLAEDLATGCLLAARKKAIGIYHISGDEMMTPFDIAMATADFFQLDKSLITPVNAAIFTQPGKRPPKTGFIISKARRDLGYQPHTFKEGLALLRKQLEAYAC